MNNKDELFPTIKRSIDKLIEDEEGNIPGNKLLMLGTMAVVLGTLMSMDVFAKHSSHRSHSSHSSHSSGGGTHSSHISSHGSHVSHQSHTSHSSATDSHSSHASHANSHTSHASHTSHSNVASHSNSLYSAEGDVTYKAPEVSKIPTVSQPTVGTEKVFKLPDVNDNIEIPNATPGAGLIPTISTPLPSNQVSIKNIELNNPSNTGELE